MCKEGRIIKTNKYKSISLKREIKNNAFTIRPPSHDSKSIREEGGINEGKNSTLSPVIL